MKAPLRAGLGLLLCLVMAAVPLACQPGGIGDPCTPEEEYDPTFSGFSMAQEYIESRSFQCATRICLVNHFQGRVSCPLGQNSASIKDCGGPGGAHEELCDKAGGESCVPSSTISPECDPAKPDVCTRMGAVCDPHRHVCTCAADGSTTPPKGYYCTDDGGVSLMKSFVCHVKGACQSGEQDDAHNAGKDCCVPGTDTPLGTAVCGQCDAKSKRAAEDAVYCSCRCGVADGEPDEPNFNFCACPSGYSCTEIRPNLHFDDPQLTGKYCVKDGTVYDDSPASCGTVAGNVEGFCHGLPAH